jgi:prepilin-type N-terminal cleavage/methylation domain-containing protein/prepilin-type processing-associated H-X9-DG protein
MKSNVSWKNQYTRPQCVKNSRGFTLIEVLVVLLIISLLASILLAAFGRVRENGRRASCQSNLKQIQVAVQMYTQDSSGHYPYYFNEYDIAYPGQPNDEPGIGWAVRIGSYLKSTEVLQCPTEKTGASSDPAQPFPNKPGKSGYTDYGYNRALSNVAESRFTFPSRTVVFIDMLPQPAIEPIDDFIRHSSGGNCVFADGHVKWMKPTQLFMIGRTSEGNPACATNTLPATLCAY